MEQTVKLTITPPSKSAPGFAKRLRRAAAFQEKIAARQLSAQLVDDMVEFIADYCEGDDKAALREILWDLSEEQFTDVLGALSGGDAQVPPVS
jgi:hypothetical protein